MTKHGQGRYPRKRKINIYAFNNGGQNVLIKAFSMKQAASGMGVSPSTFSQWGSKTNNKPDTVQVDYDFTARRNHE